uniref:Uncharacterized protein n=1 Tax=Aplanochytrium stocchinoi TaxID=215587 RepID=A0A7S3LMP9_9STRA|mmetsp:Transcript_13411/g.16682  ORF Transcript_13411/g.16682 Transcript_13411/m.16682 type:complete len:152 (-) Transcript_13411:211-666(-)
MERTKKLRTFILTNYGEFLRSERYLFLAFTVYEGMLVNLPAAGAFLFAPSFTARELAPRYRDDPIFDHPAIKILLRLFGATEILVAGMFVSILNKGNAKTFLKTVLVGDIVHYFAYIYFTLNHFKFSPGILAHFFTMKSVILTKVLYLMAN